MSHKEYDLGCSLDDYFGFCRDLRAGSGAVIFQHPFQKSRRKHFAAWAQRNCIILKKILPPELFAKVIHRVLDEESAREAAVRIEKFHLKAFSVGGATFYDLITCRRKELQNCLDILTAQFLGDAASKAERLVERGIGIMLIRPEIFYLKNIVIDFLNKYGYEEVLARVILLRPEQYFSLYNHVFSDPVKESHVRRRALGYVNQACWIVLLRKPSSVSSGADLVIDLSTTLKGVVSVENINTLRGGICYNEAWVNHFDSDPNVRLALDPCGSYTLLDHTTAHLPERDRFISNLHGVHIPNEREIVKDMCILCGSDVFRTLLT